MVVRPFVSLSGGAAASSQMGSSQTFPVANAETDSFYAYTARRIDQTAPSFGISAGGQLRLDQDWTVNLGLTFFKQGEFLARGGLTQGADSESADSYYYQYFTSSAQVHAEAKLIYDYGPYHPYVLFSFGPSFNNLYRFTTDVPAGETFTNQFRDGTTAAFSFSLGLGMEFDFFDFTRLGVGYRIFKLGPGATDTALLDGTATAFRLQQTSPTLHLLQFYLMAFL